MSPECRLGRLHGPQERAIVQVLDTLSRILPPERLLRDNVSMMAYECDGFPMHRQPPLAVALPRTTAEVQQLVRLCCDHGVTFLGRGAGTGLSGGATPDERPTLVIEMAAMKRILAVEPDDRIAVVEPGVVNLELSRTVQPFGLCYAPDPSSQSACTLGGNASENSGGPHCFKYGMTTDHLIGAKMVLASGELVELNEGEGPDLLGLATGSEGTFGIFTELTVRLLPVPELVRTWLAAFATMGQACRAVSSIVASNIVPAALEVLDHLTIQAVEASVYAAGYPADAAAVLLVELDGTRASVDSDSPLVEQYIAEQQPLSIEGTTDAQQRKRLWQGRKGAFGAMGRLAPDLYVLDGVVPRSRLEPVLQRVVEIGREYDVTLSNVFHAGDGNLHPNISYDGRDPVVCARVKAAGMEILKLCVDEGGSITGEHGVGREKLDHVPLMFTDVDIEVFHDVKRCFDPNELCNPGKAFPSGGACGEGRSARNEGALGAR